jgi:hypothetical protein
MLVLVFSHTMSASPSPLKSPAPAMFHCRGTMGKLITASGTGGTGTAASPSGSLNPVMKLALIAAPVVALYAPTVSPNAFATKRVLPDNTSPETGMRPPG